MRRATRLRIAAGLALAAAVALVLVLVLSAGSPSSGSSNAGTGSGATTVERRDLVQTDTESGTLSYSDPQTVYDRLSGTITWLPQVGEEIKPGDALYKVDGNPVILMNGSTPAYRDLTPDDSAGADIGELNRNLIALGFNSEGIVADDTWQAATTAGVDLFQESLGESPTGSLSLGQVVFLPGDQLVSTIDAALGGTGGASPGSSSNTSTSVRVARPTGEFVSLELPSGRGAAPERRGHHAPSGHNPPKHGGTASPPQTVAALTALLRAQSAELQALAAELRAARAGSSSPHGSTSAPHSSSSAPSSGSADSSPSTGASNDAGSPSGGGGGSSAQAALQTTSTQLVVTVDLPASVQSEAVVGEQVSVEMPAGNTVEGKITAVSPVAQSSSGSGSGGNGPGSSGNGGNGSSSSSSTILVTIALSGRQAGPGLDEAAVSVNFAQARANNVLSVPVTALLAQAGGTYSVQEAAAPHQLIPVSTGLFAAGYVQISGSGIYPGLQVTDSQG